MQMNYLSGSGSKKNPTYVGIFLFVQNLDLQLFKPIVLVAYCYLIITYHNKF